MRVKDFIDRYKEDGLIRTIAEMINNQNKKNIQLKGLKGSLDAVVASSVYLADPELFIFLLEDKESAAYFQNDLENLLSDREIFLFPASYKRPYQFDEVENANILVRTEILNRLNHISSEGGLIVTYPDALTEKVISRQVLEKNTITLKVGQQLDIYAMSKHLSDYDFEKADFVYEAGQYAIRGGIIDIFSYAHELPYRIELWGDEIESIRTFNPDNQLSVDKVNIINIIPNVQTKLLEEKRQSLLDFLPSGAKIWIKDYQHVLDTIDHSYKKAQEKFSSILEESGDTQVSLSPDELFENAGSFQESLKENPIIEFGSRFCLDADKVFTFDAKPQPSFNKNFDLLVEDLRENQVRGFQNIIAADSEKQIESLASILEELDPNVNFHTLPISLYSGFIDAHLGIACYTDHQVFERFHRYKTPKRYSQSKSFTLKELKHLQPGDYITHIDYGVGRFVGLDAVDINGKKQEVLRLIYRDNDLLSISVHNLHKIAKYTGKEGVAPMMSKLGSQEWHKKKKRVKKKIKDIAKDLIHLYAKRKTAPGYHFSKDNFMQAELETSFIYEDTPDQARATEEVKNDMESPHPMDRLVCGDVGFGKTEVAIRAAFKAVCDSKQVAVLVPTTILAMQHYHTFKERLANFPVRIEYINRFKSSKEIKESLQSVTEGTTDILIGTHRMISKDVHFKDLGLLVIDEEQKFGVKMKERLKEIKTSVDTLTLTATPIPRTLHFSLMGARDLSIISTPPPNRQPVITELHTLNEKIIRDAISFELKRGGQVFFVHNRVADIEQVAGMVVKLVPEAKVGIAHGQMQGVKLEKVMLSFIEGNYDVLVSTNIIESGLDIPNANTIIINQAHMFGLSDLHQMRGRVGRSNRKAFCYLLSPPTIALSPDARKRLTTLEEFSDLGDGFKVAMRDLDIRGAGNLLGAEQSGFISDMGFDVYHKILDEAVAELKETEFKELFQHDPLEKAKVLVEDCVIETDLEILIPPDYVSNITERLRLYTQLDNIKDEAELMQFTRALVDRFGPVPGSVVDLIDTVRLRWSAEQLGFEKLKIKSGSMQCSFVSSDNEAYYKSSTFGKMLQYIQLYPQRCRMREIKNQLRLFIDNIQSIKDAQEFLMEIVQYEPMVNNSK